MWTTVLSGGVLKTVSVGSWASLPYRRNKGNSPIELCGLALLSSHADWTPLSPVCGKKCTIKVLTSLCGWYEVLVTSYIPSIDYSSFISPESELSEKSKKRKKSSSRGTQ